MQAEKKKLGLFNIFSLGVGGAIGSGKGTGGAVVVMDVTDGSIVALSSYPTFTPTTFVGGITQDELDLLQSSAAFSPLLNRAIQGT